ncbi:sensor histidine kinase [Pseudomonas sp. Gutcm_11s]|uniref:sensor histidine kinase n=1 Tax=Pseudomonas sp. Gutcm_11s TaxID=3026088 RepID=UPI00235DD76E|nr:sensor histidine kinase [Pseudomonas sp. Gutcm_11s]MDD0842477.1 histidine kinase sensor domain-containing protein [Pseudomonas sp. Gutcm_11s]
MPTRHSLFWKLTGALALFCLLLASLHLDLGRWMNEATSRLPESSRQIMISYARDAESAWRERGAQGVDEYLRRLREREQVWAVVVDAAGESLALQPLSAEERERLSFIRPLRGLMGRPTGWPTFYIPFSDGEHRLVMELPQELSPRKYRELWELLLQRILPAVLAVLLGVLLYRSLIAPLGALHRQALALSAGKLGARVGEQVTARRDELGELGRAFDHMAGRLEHTVAFQRQLLRDLSHELRTPLSRLRVAGECASDLELLRDRLEREVQCMQRLVDDTLELVWMDTERPQPPLEDIDVPALWGVISENACFESGWSAERLRCELPAECRVRGHLNGLAQALENIVRNAIRHSPPDGEIHLGGRRDGGFWQLHVEDQGGGVPVAQLKAIFHPFTRLNASRPGGDGFGLGLAIARGALRIQGGVLWAENGEAGLRLNLRLPSV